MCRHAARPRAPVQLTRVLVCRFAGLQIARQQHLLFMCASVFVEQHAARTNTNKVPGIPGQVINCVRQFHKPVPKHGNFTAQLPGFLGAPGQQATPWMHWPGRLWRLRGRPACSPAGWRLCAPARPGQHGGPAPGLAQPAGRRRRRRLARVQLLPLPPALARQVPTRGVCGRRAHRFLGACGVHALKQSGPPHSPLCLTLAGLLIVAIRCGGYLPEHTGQH